MRTQVPRVVKVPADQIETFVDGLKSRLTLSLQEPHQYEKLRAFVGGKLIVAYSTGKVVYDEDTEIQDAVLAAFRSLGQESAFEILVGSDEAGKGEWLGPLVVAAVAVDSDTVPLLQAEGVMDSKLIDPERTPTLAAQVERLSLSVERTVIGPARFNELFGQLKAEGKGLNKLLAWAHRNTLETILGDELLSRGSVRVVVDEFDKFWSRAEFAKLTANRRIGLDVFPRAEENVAVAAASIVARAAREEWIDDKSKELGVDLRKLTVMQLSSRAWANEVAKLDYVHDD
jgi:ribonuclease HIII